MRIPPEDWLEVSALLDEALDLPADARGQWLARLDPARRRMLPLLEKLIAENATDGLVGGTLPGLGAGRRSAIDPAYGENQIIGGYRLLRLLGQGGMGIVWLAEREDGMLRRKVALKLPYLPLLTPGLVERFHRERDILATLAHPNIARLYDAGVTATGQPYLALEYVDGLPLHTYCDQGRLALDARIRLFLQVLEAVQHAHAHLVVHRDLKPSNILVTDDGSVRLLDFGVAKLIPTGESEASELTRQAGRAYTLEYASPEQVRGQPISVASDVYSLGVVLYELLTGTRPYRPQRPTLSALEDAVLAAEPMRPSAAATDETVADARGVTLPRLRRQLAGDLDTILLKVLRKEPGQRYPTCEAYGRDLGRYLRGEAVLARPDSRVYRLAKFARRNWVAVGASLTIAAALLVGASVSLWQARLAREHAQQAEAEAKRAQRERGIALAVKDFLVGVFRANDPDEGRFAARSEMPAREILAEGIRRLERAFQDQPETRSELADTVVQILFNLDELDQAKALAQDNVAFAARALGERHERYAAALLRHAEILRRGDDIGGARAAADRAASVLDALNDQGSILRARLLVFLGTNPAGDAAAARSDVALAERGVALLAANGADATQRAGALLDLGHRYAELGDAAKALQYLRGALDQSRGFEGAALFEAKALSLMATVLASTGELDEAKATQRRAVDAAARLAPGHPQIGQQMVTLGQLLHMHGERREGRSWIKRGLEQLARAHGERANATASARIAYAHALLMDGAGREAAGVLATLLRPGAGATGLEAGRRIEIGLLEGRWNWMTGKLERAEGMLQECDRLAAGHSPVLSARVNLALARVAVERGRLAAALRAVDVVGDYLQQARASGVLDASVLAARFAGFLQRERLLVLSEIAEREARRADAVSLADEAAALHRGAPPEEYAEEDEARIARRQGEARLAAGDATGARPFLERAVAIYQREHDPASPLLARTRASLSRSGRTVTTMRGD